MPGGIYGEPAAPFTALLRELSMLGWSTDRIAVAAHLGEETVRHIVAGEVHVVRASTAHKLKALVLDRLTEAEAAAYRDGRWLAELEEASA